MAKKKNNTNLFTRLDELLGIDYRTLALVRILLGIIIIADLIIRALALSAHYTDKGLLMRVDAICCQGYYTFSVHFLNGSPEFMAILFFIAGIFALMLILGYKTKLATIASWILLVSLHNRNGDILQAGDVLLRMLMFWGMFLPWGKVFSIDSLGQKTPKNEKKYTFSLVTFATLLQVAFVYLFTALLKTGPQWRLDGTAVYYALSIDQLSTAFGRYLLNFPKLLKFATFGTFYFEAFGSLLLFFPIKNKWFRLFGVFAFISMHIMFGAGLKIGLFPMISMASVLFFLPGVFWDELAKIKLKTPQKLQKFWKKFTDIFPGKQSVKEKKSALKKVAGTLTEILALFFFIYILVWNMARLDNSRYRIPTELNWVANVFRVDQNWSMFAPYPLINDGWFVIEGKTKSGTSVDLFRGGETVSYEKPAIVSNDYKTYRWREYMMNLSDNGGKRSRGLYARYLCNEWNTKQTDKEALDKVDIIFMQEKTLPNYNTSLEKKELLEYKC